MPITVGTVTTGPIITIGAIIAIGDSKRVQRQPAGNWRRSSTSRVQGCAIA
jgi:hypothetical protein